MKIRSIRQLFAGDVERRAMSAILVTAQDNTPKLLSSVLWWKTSLHAWYGHLKRFPVLTLP